MVPSRKPLRHPPMVLGWREWVGLPDLGVPAIRAKLDTGALSSALHVADVQAITHGKKHFASFRVVLSAKPWKLGPRVEAEVVDHRSVRSSFGRQQTRWVIITTVDVAGFRWDTELTLTERPEMTFRMLIGRRAMSGRILVDPHRSYLAGRPARKGRTK